MHNHNFEGYFKGDTIKLERGGVLGQGNGQRFMGKVAVHGYGSVLIVNCVGNSEARGLSMSISKPKEVELSWILLIGLNHFKLLIV